MAETREDFKNQELNFVIKSLGKRGNTCTPKWNEQENHFWKNLLYTYTEFVSNILQNDVMFRYYGSAVEDLNCQTLDDGGDLDIMVFPGSDDSMIQDELIEYLPENPLHVRIKGADHPVLQSCLVEDSEYVATAALKSFHPAIYGSFSGFFPGILQVMSYEELSSTLRFNPLKNSATSPAATLDFSLYPEVLRSTSLQSSMVRESENLNQFPETLMCEQVSDKSEGLDDNSEKKRTEDHNENQRAPTACKTEPLERSLLEFHKEIENQRETKAYKTKPELYVQTGEQCKAVPNDANYLRCKNEDDKREKKQMSEQTKRNNAMKQWLQHIFGTLIELKEDPSEEKKRKDTENSQCRLQVAGGIDYVPAFRSRGWPKVARAWITRERKWPSPYMVRRVAQEGCYFVVKPPKNSGNPDCDFRISFSHAEYLLSQEMNDIQRECYRCLKRYHRAYLSTKPKGLVSFHLKNIFLQTIEETGAEMWTASNRAECMMKLLENLLGTLKKKHLPHYFVRTYNLFCADYIEKPEILESLATKVFQLMENPMKFAKELIKNLDAKNTRQLRKEESAPSSDLATSVNYARAGIRKGNARGEMETPSNGHSCIQSKEKEATHRGCSSITSHQYQDLKNIFIAVSKELTDMAFNDAGRSRLTETLDPLERALVEDLREIRRKGNIPVEEFPTMFDLYWGMAFWKVWLCTEPNMRRRMLDGIRGFVEMLKYFLKQNDFAPGNEETIVRRMLDPAAEDHFDLNHLVPTGVLTTILKSEVSTFSAEPRAATKKVDMDDIPLD